MAKKDLGAESVRDNPATPDPFDRSEITRPEPAKPWDEDSWYKEIDAALGYYARIVDALREPCIDPMTTLVRHTALQVAISELARRGITVGAHIGHA